MPSLLLIRNQYTFSLIPLYIFAVCVFIIVIYWNSIDGSFVFDDTQNIISNPNIHIQTLDWQSIKGTFESIRNTSFDRPFAYLTFGLNYYFHEFDVFGYHLVNLIVHCLSALFLYLFIFHTLRLPILKGRYEEHAATIALLATVLWATSPIQVTAVTYIVQRMASMAGMFFIMAMFFYLKGRTAQGIWRKVSYFIICFIAGFLSLATKENAALLPVVLFVFDLLLIQGATRENIRKNILWGGAALLCLVVVAFIVTNPLNILSGYNNREFTLTERLLTQPRILIFYVSLMLYPVMDRFTLIHEVQLSTSLFTPWTTLPAILFWVGVVGFALYIVRKRPLISFCILFFLINHLIESSFIPLELIFEHRNYIPSMTLFLLVAIGIFQLLEYLKTNKKFLAYGFVALLLCFFIFDQGHTVVKRNELFHHPLYIWEDNAQKAPGLSRTYTNLGLEYWALGQYEKAKQSYLRAIEADRYHRHSLRAAPLINLGSYYLYIAEDPVTAIEYFEQAREIRPKYWPIWYRQSLALIHLDELEYAAMVLEQATQQIQTNADFHVLYSFVHLHSGDEERAVLHARQAMLLNPENSQALKVMGEAHRRLGNHDQAINVWQDFLRRNPNDLEAHLSLVDLGSRTGRNEVLIPSAVRLLSLKGEQTWEELFSTLPKYKSELVFTDDPMNLLPPIRQGVDLAMQ
ncbi:tetratricopeptide repeat protein [Desulfonatronovibrio magnus]|uniref:tetratricopeptide repeat protein n=1 Tax=Desulfonatronovibrio magnus TaxID=698827 RepID=UPI0005EADBB0|nr:tetratricopeptide repeat protein [Desulfonatronovibrio magnus]